MQVMNNSSSMMALGELKKNESAANDTVTDVDRATIQKEVDQLKDQIDDNAFQSTFNGLYPLVPMDGI